MTPKRILIILPCCIGDVIMATASLSALRRAYPKAHIAWMVGGWSKNAILNHAHLNAIVDLGSNDTSRKLMLTLPRVVNLIRAGKYDLLVSFVRSPVISLAALASGVPIRAGLDSGGRGFGYTVKAKVDPDVPRHEADIYLDVVRALDIKTTTPFANVAVLDADREAVRDRLDAAGIAGKYLVVHPGGGQNPGMTLDAKRYPPDKLAALANRLAAKLDAAVVVIGSPKDQALVDAVREALIPHHAPFTNLSFGQIAALAAGSALYIGNDTGMTHLASAAGAKTVAIFGPSDPKRYAPFGKDVLTLWRSTDVGSRGVAGGAPVEWDWDRNGISVEDAEKQILDWLPNVHKT